MRSIFDILATSIRNDEEYNRIFRELKTFWNDNVELEEDTEDYEYYDSLANAVCDYEAKFEEQEGKFFSWI
jgi:hypothetical protein